MTAKTVAIGVALVLVGVLLGLNVPMAEAQRGGPYAISAAGTGNTVWRADVRTGQVSYCIRGTSDPFSKPPICSPWGPTNSR